MTTTSPAIEMAALDAVAQADLVRRKEVTPAELAQWAIERIEDLNPTLNAVITPMYDQALSAAAATTPPTDRLAGVPCLVKDLIAEVTGVPFSEGSRFLRGHVSHFDSELVLRLRRAGLVIMGKTNTPEFGMAPTCEPVLHGPTRNPWDTARLTSGSSGGRSAENLDRVLGQAVQEIDDVKVAGQRVRQAHKGPGQHGLAGGVSRSVTRTGIPRPDGAPGTGLTHRTAPAVQPRPGQHRTSCARS